VRVGGDDLGAEPVTGRPFRPADRLASFFWLALMVPTTATVVYLSLYQARPVLALLGLGLLVGLAVVAPIRVLLWSTVFSFGLIPFHYLALGQPLSSFPPPTLLLLAATLAASRLPPRGRPGSPGSLSVLLGGGFVAYTALISVMSPYSNMRHAITWIVLTALLLVLVPLWLSRYPGAPAVLSSFEVLGALLAAMAIAESVLQTNPLDGLYAGSPDGLTQSWGVYRVFTTLGHPLVNGTVFAVTLTLVWSRFLTRRSWARAFVMVGLLAAVFLTASRGALLASVVGAVLAFLIHTFRRNSRSGAVGAVAIVTLAAVGGWLAWSSSVLGQRNASLEGENSADLRLTLVKMTPQMLHETHYLGSGADTSFAVWSAVGGAYGQFPLENSLIQFIVDFGVLGTLLYVGFVLALVVPAVKRGAVAGPAAFAAYLVSAGGFNLYEAYTSALILPCLLLTLTLMESKEEPERIETPGRRGARASGVDDEHAPVAAVLR
jgi:hypothetical protein